ncbi:HAMP domain-containing sensor histidine kinase [Methylocystis sp. Sn-Cys]|uniref:sensor histidine kinase n=1 Tax=Methylocystis sp. Sn-Cys TaxID=1701263 RepID=UPI0019209A74|nr:HAMP domain-containing histidine kinase [Methylocystis sp. Sn-Cys]MBL1257785.1 HAMP domain-containing histidine kinase [Methylocystis sp. Sn-Cys]
MTTSQSGRASMSGRQSQLWGGEKPPVAALPQVIFAQRLALESVLGNLITNALRAIFEPFWRKENTTTGTGLGLSIAREIIGKLGGKIGSRKRRVAALRSR